MFALLLATPFVAQAAPVIGAPTQDANGVWHYPVTSSYQTNAPNDLRVLLPATMGQGQRRFLYMLPVEPGTDAVYGDPIDTARALGVLDALHIILVVPAFSITPWYADHPSDPMIRQESYLVEDIVPAVEELFPETPTNLGPPRRLLLGFSKSGMGAISLIFRHSSMFDAAAAWDAPLNQATLSGLPGMATVFGTQANYDTYAIPSAIPQHTAEHQGMARLWLGGYSSQVAWRNDETAAHNAMAALGMAHAWEDGPQRVHRWDSGWVGTAIAFLDMAAPAMLFTPGADGGVEDAGPDGGVGGQSQDAGMGGAMVDGGVGGQGGYGGEVGVGGALQDAGTGTNAPSGRQSGCGCSAPARDDGEASVILSLLGWIGLIASRRRGSFSRRN